MKTPAQLLLPLLVSSLLTACLDSSSSSSAGYTSTTHNAQPTNTAFNSDTELRSIIQQHGLTGDPMRGKSLPDIQGKRAQLGRELFFSKSLSGGRDTACASCHHPVLGGGDQLSLPVGVDAVNPGQLGPGRFHTADAEGFDGGPPVPRNAPTTFNIAGWNKVMFHDGRIEALDGNRFRTPDSAFGTADPVAGTNLVHAQARFPITSPEEMKGFENKIIEDVTRPEMRYFVAARMGNYDRYVPGIDYPDYWLGRFRDALDWSAAPANHIITEQNISLLLSEYQRSQNFTNSPWRKYIEGNTNALSSDAKQGAMLFYRRTSEGGANCVSCHSGDFFTDENFHNIGMPQLGRGKGDGDDAKEDFGRFRETQDTSDMYAFRTPSLLNVEVTGPWGHVGAYTSLEATIRHHLNPAEALDNYNYSQLNQPGIQNLDKLYTYTRRAIDAPNYVSSQIHLSDAEVKQLVAFMHSLTDPCTKSHSCLSPWIANRSTDNDPNGDQLNAQGL